MAAKTPSPRKPSPTKGYGGFGSASSVPEQYLFGTEAEINGRNAEGYSTNPADAAPSFTQIRPGPTGQDANTPEIKRYVGDSKFGSPRRYAQMDGQPGAMAAPPGMGMGAPSPGGGPDPALMMAMLNRKKGGGKRGRRGGRRKKK